MMKRTIAETLIVHQIAHLLFDWVGLWYMDWYFYDLFLVKNILKLLVLNNLRRNVIRNSNFIESSVLVLLERVYYVQQGKV